MAFTINAKIGDLYKTKDETIVLVTSTGSKRFLAVVVYSKTKRMKVGAQLTYDITRSKEAAFDYVSAHGCYDEMQIISKHNGKITTEDTSINI